MFKCVAVNGQLEEPIVDEDEATVHFFMESLARLDPFNFLSLNPEGVTWHRAQYVTYDMKFEHRESILCCRPVPSSEAIAQVNFVSLPTPFDTYEIYPEVSGDTPRNEVQLARTGVTIYNDTLLEHLRTRMAAAMGIPAKYLFGYSDE